MSLQGAGGSVNRNNNDPAVIKDELDDMKRKLEDLKMSDSLPPVQLEKYKGKMDKRDFNEFLKEFYTLGNMYGWTERKCCLILPAYLANEAAAAYETIDNDVKKRWRDLTIELARKLARAEDLSFQRRLLFDAKQKPAESIAEFGLKIRELVKRAYPTNKNYTDVQRESIAVDHFVNGLNAGIQTEVMRKDPHTLSQAIDFACKEESLQNRVVNCRSQNEISELKEQMRSLKEKVCEVNLIANQQKGQSWLQRGRNWFRGRNFSSFRGNYNGNRNWQGNNQQNNSNWQQNGPSNPNYQQNNWQGNFRGQNRGRPQNRGRGQQRGRGRGRGYSINEVSSNFLPVITLFCICVNLFAGTLAKEYMVCPQPRTGYLLAWPSLQDCDKTMVPEKEVKAGQIEIYVPKTAPTFIPGFKCVKQVTQYCTKRIFRYIDIEDWQTEWTESVNENECWLMAKNASNAQGRPLVQKNEDLWETKDEEISLEYAIFGTKCVNASKWKLQIGTVGSLDGKGMVSELEELSRCAVDSGTCLVANSTIVWPKPNGTTFCNYESAGTFQSLITDEYYLIEEIQAAFVASENELPEDIKLCVPENSKLMENDVVIYDAKARVKRKANSVTGQQSVATTTARPSRLPPLANTTFNNQHKLTKVTSNPISSTTQSTVTTRSTVTTQSTVTTRSTVTTQGTVMKQTNGITNKQAYSTNNGVSSTGKAKNTIKMATTISTTQATTTKRFKNPFDMARGQEAFYNYFRENRLVTESTKTTKVHVAYHINTRPPPIALAQVKEFKQENNNVNVKMQYGAIKLEERTTENFSKVWQQICRLHNYQMSIIRSILRVNPKEGVRLWLNRQDLTAVHNGEAVLVAPCTVIRPKKIFWSHTINDHCFEYTPVQVDNMTLFIIPGTNELSLHSPNISCQNKPVPAYKDKDGEWRTEYGIAQVSNANQILIAQNKQKLIKFRASSIFNSDLHRVITSIDILSAYAKRINMKISNIPRMAHIEDTSDFSGVSNILDKIIESGESLVNGTFEIGNPLNKIISLFDSWQAIVRNVCIILVIAISVGGIIYAYPWWGPILRQLRPSSSNRKAITVAAIDRRSAQSFEMLNFYPEIYSIDGSFVKGKKAHIKIKVNGRNVVAMVDPGAEITYCRESVAKHLKLKINKKDIPYATVANQTRLPLIGSATVKIKMEEREFTHPILVSSDQLCPAPILLGTDITDDVRCNFKDQFVVMDGTIMPMIMNINVKMEHKVFVPVDVRLAPHSDNLIMGETKSRFPKGQNVLAVPTRHNYDYLLVGKSISCPGSTQKIPIRIMNFGNKEVKVHANSNIGKLEVVDEGFIPKTVFHIDVNIPQEEPKQSSKKAIKGNVSEAENWEEFFPNLSYFNHPEKDLNKIDLTESALSIEGKIKLIEIIKAHNNAFVNGEEIGSYTGPVDHVIHLLPNTVPSSQRPYRVPMALRDEVERQIKDLLAKKIIRPSSSAFCAPIVLVKKKDNTYRMAIDYRQLNKNTTQETYIMPLIQDILDICGGKKIYTSFDFKMGFYQINMRPEDIEKTAFGTFLGLYEFIKMPFGLKGAPGTFMRAMNEMRRELTSAIFVYMDDVVLASNSEDDHLRDIAQFLKVVIKNGMKLHLGKCKFAMHEIKYLGMLISENGIRPDPKNIEAVKQFEQPKTITQLRSFIGAVSYFRKFVYKFAEIMKPLYELTKQEKIKWEKEHEMAFHKIIEKLTTAPVLKTPRWGEPFVLETDASNIALAACLLQKDRDKNLHPIAYWSRILNKHEKNYHSTELEALAIVEAIKHFEAYLEGSGQTVVRTDNSAACSLLKKKDAKGRLARFQMILQNFDLVFEHRTGKSNTFCDYVSRYAPADVKNIQICEIHIHSLDREAIRSETIKDPIMVKLMKVIRKENDIDDRDSSLKQYAKIKKELIVENNIIETLDGKIVIPEVLRENVLKVLHRAHFGSTKMKAKARKLVYWPNIDKDIEATVDLCEQCKKYSTEPPKVPLTQWEPTNGPWQRLHIDFAGPFLGIMYLVVIDSFSKYPFIKIMKSTTSENTIDTLEELFSQFGYPSVVVSDNGPQLVSDQFEDYLERNGIIHKKSPPYHPSSNGLAERFVRTSKSAIQKMVGEKNPTKKELTKVVRVFLQEYRSTPHSTTNETPAKLFLRRDMKTSLEMILSNEQMNKKKLSKENVKQKEHYDNRVGTKSVGKSFDAGDAVWFRTHGDSWTAGTVSKQLGNSLLEVVEEDGSEQRVHTNQTKERKILTRRQMNAAANQQS